VLVFIAFLVAGGSLLLQGGTLARVFSWVKPATVDPAKAGVERVRLMALLDSAADEARADEARAEDARADRSDPGDTRWPAAESKRLRLAEIASQRAALLRARDDGTFSASSLNAALSVLDADQVRLELTGAPADEEN
jgi:CPA1 family monovalent cation:H+ antiporter